MSHDEDIPMEGDQRKQQRYTKRRERVHSKLDPDGGKDEMDSSPSRSDGDKPRAKPPRRRRNRSHSHDEDIIDGFAILSFKSLEDLVSFIRLLFISLISSTCRPIICQLKSPYISFVCMNTCFDFRCLDLWLEPTDA